MAKSLPPALMPASSLAVGIMLSAIASLSWWWGIVLIAVSIVGYLVILSHSGNPVKTYKAGKWHFVWVLLLFLGIGIIDGYNSRPLSLQEAYRGDVPELISGEIINILPKTYGDRIEVEIAAANGTKAQLRSGATSFSKGDIISFPSSRLTAVEADSSEVVAGISKTLRARGILYTAFVPSKYISLEGRSKSVAAFCAGIRDGLEIKIERSHLHKETSDFIKAILMGDKSGLDEETRMTFANGGIAHMLALSGLHMGILAGLIMIVMWPLRAIGKYKLGYALALVLLWIYVFVTGLSHSSVRACIMISLAFIAIIVERKNAVGHALCSACLLILLAFPYALFDAGFQLSVVCVGSLVSFASHLNPIHHRQHPFLFRLCEAILSTMVATLASWAFISYYFGQIPLMFLPTNLILLPLIPLYLCLSVIFVLLLCIGLEPYLLASSLDSGYEFLLWGAARLSCGGDYIIDYHISIFGLAVWITLLSISALAINCKR